MNAREMSRENFSVQKSDADKMAEARSCLYSALRQALPTDDAIIMSHVREAFILLGGDPAAVERVA